MNDNYLWDRSGEPDAEVQQLEELLGTLRYNPRPLEIPATINFGRTRRFIPAAIAAAIALLMIGTGLWVRFSNSKRGATEQASSGSPAVPKSPETTPKPNQSVAVSVPPVQRQITNAPAERRPGRTFAASRVLRSTQKALPLTREELAQKEQVLIALRLVSAKLNLAQRKAQGIPQVNAIRNQHKIG